MINKKRNGFKCHSTKKIANVPPLSKRLMISFAVLLAAVLSIRGCIEFDHKPKDHVLSVPVFYQIFDGWCGAACIQMWGYYDGKSPVQEDIADYIGNYFSDPYWIAQGVTQFTNTTGYPRYWASWNQDVAISAEVASAADGVPSIPIVNAGTHAVIMKGYKWTETEWGVPRADGIHFNDPLLGSRYRSAAEWKEDWFTLWDGTNYAVVLGAKASEYESDGEAGFNEFLERGGTYYGAPKDGEDPPPIEV